MPSFQDAGRSFRRRCRGRETRANPNCNCKQESTSLIETFARRHYHALAERVEKNDDNGRDAVALQQMEAVDDGGGMPLFTYRCVPGRSTQSYGIEVAEIAGVAPVVLERARALRLEEWETVK